MNTFFRQRRDELQLTQRQIADAIRPPMTSAAVGQWDRGAAMPDLGLVPQLAVIYQVSESRLIKEIMEFKADRRE